MPISGVWIPIVGVICVACTIIGVPIARAYSRRVERGPLEPSVPPEVSARLARMEQALDSIAIEVERISEGQRFTTKLLSERSRASSESSPQRLP